MKTKERIRSPSLPVDFWKIRNIQGTKQSNESAVSDSMVIARWRNEEEGGIKNMS